MVVEGVMRRRFVPSVLITNSAPDPVGLTPSFVSKKLSREPSGEYLGGETGPWTSCLSPPPSEARTV